MANNDFQSQFQPYSIPFLELGVKLPRFEITKEYKDKYFLDEKATDYDFLFALCIHGLEIKIGHNNPKYKEYYNRMKYELDIIKELGFCSYILIIWEICSYCDENNIARGTGRGSACGSIVLYLINVTKIDALKHKLYFQRFISKTRAKYELINNIPYYRGDLLMDADLDIDFSRRWKVIEWLNEKYNGKIAKISNVSTLTTKILLKEISKVVGEFSEEEANKISNLIPSEYGQPYSLERTIEEIDDFKEFSENNPKIIEISKKLSGLNKHFSVHASAWIISSDPIDGLFPLQLDRENEIITGYTMNDDLNLAIKVDILGLRCATLISEVCKLIGIKIEDIDIDDEFIYKRYQDLKTPKGLFQLEADFNYMVLKAVKPKNIDQLAAVLSLARPGVSQFISKFAEYVETGQFVSLHPFFDEVLKDTASVILFQEQILMLVHKVGFTLDEAELLRRALGHKDPEAILQWENKLKEKIKEQNLDEEIFNILWKVIKDSIGYSYNRSHALAYSYLSAITTYLKFKYPREFYYILLKLSKDEADTNSEIMKIQSELSHFDIKLLGPHIVKSDMDFKLDENGRDIRFGLSYIKGIADKTMEKLLNFRHSYSDKFDIFAAAEEAKLSISILCSLIASGCMDDNLYDCPRSRLIYEAQIYTLLKPKEKKYIKQIGPEYQYKLVDCIKALRDKIKDEKGRPVIKESRYLTIKKHAAPFLLMFQNNSKNEDLLKYFFEKRFLGFAYSTSLWDIYIKHVRDLDDIKVINNGTAKNERVHLVGELTFFERRLSKEKKNPYWKMMVKDNNGEVKILLANSQKHDKISEMIELNGRKPMEGDIVMVRGKTGDGLVFAENVSIQKTQIYDTISKLKNFELNENNIE